MDATVLVSLLWPLLGALIGASAANARGFSVAGGVIGGALLGIASPLLYMVSENRVKCAACCEWISKEAKICHKCRSEVAS